MIERTSRECTDDEKREIAIIVAGVFGIVGAGVGAIIGGIIRTDRWEKVPVDRIRLGFAPQRDGGAVISASLAF